MVVLLCWRVEVDRPTDEPDALWPPDARPTPRSCRPTCSSEVLIRTTMVDDSMGLVKEAETIWETTACFASECTCMICTEFLQEVNKAEISYFFSKGVTECMAAMSRDWAEVGKGRTGPKWSTDSSKARKSPVTLSHAMRNHILRVVLTLV
jgi:hypothetical protein